MGNLCIQTMTNKGEGFYFLLGPFLANRAVVRELGIPAWDDPGKVWYIGVRGDKVCGFVAVTHTQKGAVFCSDYVVPDERSEGVYRQLFEARMEDYTDEELITATVAPKAVALYAEHGFVEVGKRGRYTAMRREKTNGNDH